VRSSPAQPRLAARRLVEPEDERALRNGPSGRSAAPPTPAYALTTASSVAVSDGLPPAPPLPRPPAGAALSPQSTSVGEARDVWTGRLRGTPPAPTRATFVFHHSLFLGTLRQGARAEAAEPRGDLRRLGLRPLRLLACSQPGGVKRRRRHGHGHCLRLSLGCLSAVPRLYLGCLSAVPRLPLGCPSAASRLPLGSRLHLALCGVAV